MRESGTGVQAGVKTEMRNEGSILRTTAGWGGADSELTETLWP